MDAEHRKGIGMYCAHCGTQNDELAEACRSCGAALAHDAPLPEVTRPGRLPTAPNQHWAVPDVVSTMLPGAPPHRRRTFWLALLAGAVILGAWSLLAGTFADPTVDIRALVFGAFFVPVLFVFFMASEGLVEEPPALVLVEVFVSVALVGNLAAWLLNSFLPYDTVLVGFIEEGVKFLAVVWLLRRRKFVSIMDGILFGAAAGMGFAASENLSYFFQAYTASGLAAVQVLMQDGVVHTLQQMIDAFNQYGVQNFFMVFMIRSFLGPWLHGSWTAIIAGVAWRESAGGRIRLDLRFFATYVVIALIHTLWDATSGTMQLVLFVAIVAVDVYFLRGLILAAHRQERGEPIRLPRGAKRERPVRAARGAHPAATCAKCGRPLRAGAMFCAGCGAAVGTRAAAGPMPTGAPVPTSTT